MPGMTAISEVEAVNHNAPLIELKVDGSRGTFDGSGLYSDRNIERSDRYGHIVSELRKLNWNVRGEIAIPDGNVLQLNKATNWHKAKFYVFDIYSVGGMSTDQMDALTRRDLIDEILSEQKFNNISAPTRFDTFEQGWSYVKAADAEGLVLKALNHACWKVKYLKEEKVKVVDHIPGRSKGSFLIERNGVTSKVSGTSDAYVSAFKQLMSQGLQPYVEIEFGFLTDEGKPYQPRVRRLGTLEQLRFT